MKRPVLIKTLSWLWIVFITIIFVFTAPVWLQKSLGYILLGLLTILALAGTQYGEEEYSKPKPPPIPENYSERVNKKVKGLKQ